MDLPNTSATNYFIEIFCSQIVIFDLSQTSFNRNGKILASWGLPKKPTALRWAGTCLKVLLHNIFSKNFVLKLYPLVCLKLALAKEHVRIFWSLAKESLSIWSSKYFFYGRQLRSLIFLNQTYKYFGA